MSETDIQARILLALGALPGTRLFRNTVGEGWQGKMLHRTAETVTLLRPRYVTFGLCPGSSDLIGWHAGRFLAIEVKTAIGDERKKQQNFIRNVNDSGGIAGIARSNDDALCLIHAQIRVP